MMKKYEVNSIVFSSSATVYGDPKVVPLTEDCPLGETTNPYGTSKAMMEKVIVAKSRTVDPEKTSIMCTRYGNVLASR